MLKLDCNSEKNYEELKNYFLEKGFTIVMEAGQDLMMKSENHMIQLRLGYLYQICCIHTMRNIIDDFKIPTIEVFKSIFKYHLFNSYVFKK
jgi:hypothetical protein